MQTFNLSGLNVCLVGPSSNIDGKGLGAEIDSHDVVCRVGRPLPIYNHIDLGSRTDVICDNLWEWRSEYPTNTKTLSRLWSSAGVHVRMVYPKHEGYEKCLQLFDGPVSSVDENWYLDVNANVPSPTKGLCAIADILSQKVKKLSIYGFTFNVIPGYCSDYMSNPYYRNPPKDEVFGQEVTHNCRREMEYFVSRVMTDDRVFLGDDVMEAVTAWGRVSVN